MKWIGNQMYPVTGRAVLEDMFGDLVADRPWMMIHAEVRRYVQDLEEALSFPVYDDLSEVEVGSGRGLKMTTENSMYYSASQKKAKLDG